MQNCCPNISCIKIMDLFRYRRVFQYLLRLKRTQMELEKSWAQVMHQDHTDFAKHRKDRLKRSISQQRRQRSRPMWRVREHMAFLIRNLQFYIQVIALMRTFTFIACSDNGYSVTMFHVEDAIDLHKTFNFAYCCLTY